MNMGSCFIKKEIKLVRLKLKENIKKIYKLKALKLLEIASQKTL